MQDTVADPISKYIVKYVEAGRDVRIATGAASVRLDAVAAQLEATCNVVRLTAPSGGLSLSLLIAQLSGRENFDDHDDSALELGFRRLCGGDAPDRRTVLLLDAAQGVQRPTLRYLQQVGGNAPRLLFVIAGCAELDAFLAAPDMARLRARLDAAVMADETALAPALSVVPLPELRLPPDWTPSWTIDVVPREAAPKRRLGLLWTASGLALVASAALGFWLGQASKAEGSGMVAKTWTAPTIAQPDRRAETAPKPVPAPVVAPPLTPTAAPGTPAAVPIPVLVKSATPAPAAAAIPPAAILAKAGPVIVASAAEPLSIPTLHPRLADTPRAARPRVVARARPPTEAPRYVEEDYYGSMDELEPAPRRGRLRAAQEPVGEYDPYPQMIPHPYGGPASRGARYDPPMDQEYLGTFATGPYGARVFRYGP